MLETLRQNAAFVVALLGLTLLATWNSGVHLHLCFDGSEPPSTLHFHDFGQHANHPVGEHHDLDVPLIADAPGKSSSSGLDLNLSLALVATIWSLALIPKSTQTVPLFLRRVTTSPPLSLRPPSRGPPAPVV